MLIPASKVRKWNSYLDHGDKQKIAKILGVSHPVISRAFNDHEATSEVIEAINEFVKSKKQVLK